MSHSYGEIWSLAGNLLAYFEYNGTVDVCQSRLFNTREEVWANWRGKDFHRVCSCGQSQPVLIYSEYGGGFYWEGKACLQCMAITDRLTPSSEDPNDEYTDKNGHPFREIPKDPDSD